MSRMEVVYAILALVVVPILVTKTTERGRFDWIHPYLRELWMCLIIVYLIANVWSERTSVARIHSRFGDHPTAAYIVVALVGALFFVSCWAVIGWVLDKAEPSETAQARPPLEQPIIPKPTEPEALPKEHHQPRHTNDYQLPPYSRTESFVVDIAYYSADDGFPLPTAVLSNEDYPLAEAYSCMAGILVLYVPPEVKQITQIAALDTTDKRAEALVQSLRACIIGDIITAERGSSRFGISATKGSIADYRPAILPPSSSDYPIAKLLATLGSLPFGKDERFLFLYKYRPMQVPEGSEVELGTAKLGKNDWMNHLVFTIVNPRLFNLTFGVAPLNAAMGVLPGSFPDKYKAQQSKYTTYSFAVTMKIEIQRNAMSASELDDYIHWSEGLWGCIRQKYDIKRPS
jgi:hypothetical protein